MEKMSKKDLEHQLKFYKLVLKNNVKANKWILQRIAKYKKELEKLD